MKKKLALLLAAAMTISLIPMNVFGATRLYVPDREITSLPANVVDLLRIDLADLDEDVPLHKLSNGNDRIIQGHTAGYPISLDLSDGEFGAVAGDPTFEQDYNGNNALSDGDVIGYNSSNDSAEFRKAMEFFNVKEGYWAVPSGGGNATPAKVYVFDDGDGTVMTKSEMSEFYGEATTLTPAQILANYRAALKEKIVAQYLADNKGTSLESNALASAAAEAALVAAPVVTQPATKAATDYAPGTFAWVETLAKNIGSYNATTLGAKIETEADGTLAESISVVTGTSGASNVPTTPGEVTSGAAVLDVGSESSVEEQTDDAWNTNTNINATWNDFEDFFEGNSRTTGYNRRAPFEFTATYSYEVWDSDQIVLFVQIFDDEGNMISVPDLDEGEAFVEVALPIHLEDDDDSNSDDWETELDLRDMTSGNSAAFTGFPRRVISDTEGSMTVDVETTASFASNGFLDYVTLNETAYGFLNGYTRGATSSTDVNDAWTNGAWDVNNDGEISAVLLSDGRTIIAEGEDEFANYTFSWLGYQATTVTDSNGNAGLGNSYGYVTDEKRDYVFGDFTAATPVAPTTLTRYFINETISAANGYTPLDRSNLNANLSASNMRSIASAYDAQHDYDFREVETQSSSGSTRVTRVVELRLDSDYAWLMENSQESLKFQDENNTFHSNTGDSRNAYEILDYFGIDDKYEDIDYNIGYEIGNRRINVGNDNAKTDFDIRFFFSGTPQSNSNADELPGEAPTDEFGKYANESGSARYGSTNSTRGDELRIYNMMVGFDDRQEFNKDIPLQYRVYDIDAEDLADGDTNENSSDRTYVELENDQKQDGKQWLKASDIPVVRKENKVAVDVLDDRLGAAVETYKDNFSGRFDAETSVFRIAELVNGTLSTGATDISVGDGVEITAAHVSVYEYDFANYDPANKTDGDRIESTTYDISRNASGDTYWTDDTNSGEYDKKWLDISRHQDVYNNGGIKITNKTITVDPRMNTLTTSGERREIEIQLKVSIEAGYVSKGRNANDPTAIEVAFSGPGASNFEQSTLKVLTVRDAITVTPPTPIAATVAGWETAAYSQNIGDVTITEGKAGDLRQNRELWLYVVGDNQTNLNLSADPNPVVSAGDIKLYAGVQLRHQYGNFWLNGMRYNVERASSLGSGSINKTPATITFENVTVSGTMYQGAKYDVVVSGNAIAENDYTVWSNGGNRTVNANGDYLSYNDPSSKSGVFDVAPYTITPINWDDTDYGTPPTTQEAPPTVETPPVATPVVVARSPRTFGLETYDIDETGSFKAYDMAAASNGVGYSGINPRSFAMHIGADYSYDEATRTFTMTGTDNNGEEVTVTLNLDSTNATINGSQVDIATFNGHPGYPAGSIKPFLKDNRSYLPIRFLCNAYKVGFTYNVADKSVTIN